MDEYRKKMNFPKGKEEYSAKKKAFELAHEIRKFEIELFWKRGTYYWAFILASFTAFFFVLGIEKISENKKQIYLCLTSFFAFLFSWLWVYMNKGSAFWLKNWEEHINHLENEFSGDLYKVFLNTNVKSEKFFSFDAYDYSVTKITMFGSVVLAAVAGLNFLLQVCFFVKMDWKCVKEFVGKCFGTIESFLFFLALFLVSLFLLLLAICLLLCYFPKFFYGNKNEQQNANVADKFVKRASVY